MAVNIVHLVPRVVVKIVLSPSLSIKEGAISAANVRHQAIPFSSLSILWG